MGKSKCNSWVGADASQAPEGTKIRRRGEVTEGLDHGLNFHIHPSNKQHPYALQLLKLFKPEMICCHLSLSQPALGTMQRDLPPTPHPAPARAWAAEGTWHLVLARAHQAKKKRQHSAYDATRSTSSTAHQPSGQRCPGPWGWTHSLWAWPPLLHLVHTLVNEIF